MKNNTIKKIFVIAVASLVLGVGMYSTDGESDNWDNISMCIYDYAEVSY